MKTYFIRGNPVPQGRARAFTRPGMKGVRFYDPGASKDWKGLVRDQVLAQSPEKIGTGPISIKAEFRLKRPVSLPKKVLHHVKKPDLDNLIKAVKDSLKGICWADDSQIVHYGDMTKKYAEPGCEGVVLTISEYIDF